MRSWSWSGVLLLGLSACIGADDDVPAVISDAGTDAAAQAACPATLPTSGSPCESGSCTYVVCSGVGIVTASCVAGNFGPGAWSLSQPVACESVTCGDQTCGPTQVCVENVGGAGGLAVGCVDNPCEGGLASCECGAQVCSGLTCLSTDGRSVQCDACGQPPCA